MATMYPSPALVCSYYIERSVQHFLFGTGIGFGCVFAGSAKHAEQNCSRGHTETKALKDAPILSAAGCVAACYNMTQPENCQLRKRSFMWLSSTQQVSASSAAAIPRNSWLSLSSGCSPLIRAAQACKITHKHAILFLTELSWEHQQPVRSKFS